jgi:hypothetical protein
LELISFNKKDIYSFNNKIYVIIYHKEKICKFSRTLFWDNIYTANIGVNFLNVKELHKKFIEERFNLNYKIRNGYLGDCK